MPGTAKKKKKKNFSLHLRLSPHEFPNSTPLPNPLLLSALFLLIFIYLFIGVNSRVRIYKAGVPLLEPTHTPISAS
jgi:hypothetical protein